MYQRKSQLVHMHSCTATHYDVHADHGTVGCVELTHIMHSHSGGLISKQQHSRVKPTTRPQQIYRQQMKQTSTWFLVLSCRFFFFFSVNQTIFFCSHVETPQKIHEILDLCPISCTQTSRGLLKKCRLNHEIIVTNMDSHKNNELSGTITFV